MKHNIMRPDLHEFDKGSESKKVVSGPLALKNSGGRNQKPEALNVDGSYHLKSDTRYLISAITDCYIAIADKVVAADNTDVVLFAKSVTVISTEGNPSWKHLMLSGDAQVVELA